MCRLYGFHGTAPMRLECGLVRAQNALISQSMQDARGLSNADGWGIGFYANGGPVLKKCGSAAFEDQHYRDIAETVSSRTLLAHVRQATIGGVSRYNAQPFSCGTWMFAHNGTLTAYEALKPLLESETRPEFLKVRLGTTDSELIFLWIMSRLANSAISSNGACPDRQELARVLADAVTVLAARNAAAGAESPATLNFLLTDGTTLAASRWGMSLFHLFRERAASCGLCGQPHSSDITADTHQATAVASEPVTPGAWNEVPDRSVMVIGPAMEVLSGPVRQFCSLNESTSQA